MLEVRQMQKKCLKCSTVFTCNESCKRGLLTDSCYCPKCFEEYLFPEILNGLGLADLLLKRITCDVISEELRIRAMTLYIMKKIAGES